MEPENDNIPTVFSIQEYLAILRRRRWIILQAFVLIAVIGVAQALMAKNVYQSSAKMLVEGPSYNLNTVDSSNPLSSLFQLSQQQTVDTQVEVLQAAPLLDQVTRQVGPAGLSVANVKDTNVIEVTGESNDPKLAAAAPNALLRLYIDQDLSQGLSEMENARRFVEKQGKAAHQRLVATEAALRSFKQANHVADLAKSRDEQISRVSALTAEEQSEQTALATLRAQIAANRALLGREPATVVVKTQATNAVRAALGDDIRKLEVARVGLIQPGGLTPNAPQVKSIDAQIADLRQRLTEQPTLATSQSSSPDALHEALRTKGLDLGAQVAPLQAQAALTSARLAEARKSIARQPVLELTQDRLTREHDSAQQQDKNFTDQLNDLVLREKAHHAAARIIESASVPTTPVRPHRMQSIIFACLIGLFVGVCLALMQEFLDDRINSADEAGRVLGLPALGAVPALTSADAHLLPQMQGLDPASESYRVLRTNINFATVDAPARTLMVTSASPGEGKSTTAANLAFAMAMDGKKVLLVDTDLRRPSLHKLLEIAPTPGLTDVLLGHAPLAPHEVMPGLSVLTAGSTPPNPGELLNSRKFRNLVDDLMAMADIVIFDSPPVLAAADAVILASQMDGTIVVVETGATKKGAARRTMQLLKQARATILGIAYNKMRTRDGEGYYYYNYQYTSPAIDVERGIGRPLLPSGPEGEEDPK